MITIRIKLMGMLQAKNLADGLLELPDDSTILSVLEHFDIDPETVHVFTLDGDLTRDKSTPLTDGIELTVLPPVGGG
ncbi:MAG: MoaD/ThiS family protein [Planctomycetales bacterium]|nr:MoaD/ThiS family protein [Planctomycetales bacterium]